jgi:hypothetical protein
MLIVASERSVAAAVMIVAITLAGHEYTLQSLAAKTFGFPTPEVRVANYNAMLRARVVPRATYLFTDIERLSPWELRLASELYRALHNRGLRCLNNPALAMGRVELLRTLNAAGLSPFRVWRGDERPRPSRFPVFVRGECDHAMPVSQTIANQRQLDDALHGLQANGIPLRGMLVIEIYTKPYSPGLWHKWGTFRVGDAMSVDHIAVDATWLVKYGAWDKLTDAAIADEHDAVLANRHAGELRRAFDLGRIAYGRADHAAVGNRTVVYEINTNPYVGHYVPDSNPLRRETQDHARQRLAASFEAIDTPGNGTVALAPSNLLQDVHRLPSFAMTPRP